jgi:hypothetical protein
MSRVNHADSYQPDSCLILALTLLGVHVLELFFDLYQLHFRE